MYSGLNSHSVCMCVGCSAGFTVTFSTGDLTTNYSVRIILFGENGSRCDEKINATGLLLPNT